MKNKNYLSNEPFLGWPSKNEKPVLCIKIRPKELSIIFGLNIITGIDDLGPYEATHYVDPVIGYVAFIKYIEDTEEELDYTSCHVDSRVSTAIAVKQIRDELNLDDSEIVWTQTIY